MAELVQRLFGDERMNDRQPFHVFGIRHLSPAGAYHLRAFLEEKKPTAVLVEGPGDASEYISQLVARKVVPPVALLAYSDQLPVRTLLYPFAVYSPEYQAFLWSEQNGVHAEFIDLPSDISLSLYEWRREGINGSSNNNPGNEAGNDRDNDSVHIANNGEEEVLPVAGNIRSYASTQHDLYEEIAALAGESDYESYWERYFEHEAGGETYRKAIHHFSAKMREITEQHEWELAPAEAAYNEIREAYMRRRIKAVLDSGHDPDKVVVVTGAHHVSALRANLPSMTDVQLAELPRSATKITLMPYSYYKLSTQSGYGAGNHAPAYYELFWRCLQRNELNMLSSLYLTHVVTHMREHGTYRSTASVIEGVRLAEALASMHNGRFPTWKDLRDAVVISLGNGELSAVAEALARTDIGTAIGSLPEGVSQTPIQDDLKRELKRLKLEKYKSVVATDLELDLRENRRVKSEAAAFLDLNRSVLLHRLELIGISFARKHRSRQDSATWAEQWVLQWTPEAEIQTVESTLKGETIQLAAAFVLHERLLECTSIVEASQIIRIACDCGLPTLMEEARRTLQRLAVDAGNFVEIATSAYELSVLIQYGSIRLIETETMIPLLQQLFLRGTLLLVDTALCSEEAAKNNISAINALHTIAQEHFDVVDDLLWRQNLEELSSRDDRNAMMSGYAFCILLERNEVSENQCAAEVSRRLSPGIPADLGAGWFEGLSLRNRYALLSRTFLWKQLDDYIHSLEHEQFQRSLVFLRRAFSTFEPREKASIAELMGDLWGSGAMETGEVLQRPLSEEEKEEIDELNDFDFGDL